MSWEREDTLWNASFKISTVEVELGHVLVCVWYLEEIELVEYTLHFVLPVFIVMVTLSPKEVTV